MTNPRRRLVALALLALAACTGTGTARPQATASLPSEITYETGACYGTCPVYSVTVRRSGKSVFEGRRFTAVAGRRDFDVDARTFASFAHLLQGARTADPRDYVPGGKRCQRQATDHPSVTVTFRENGGVRRFPFYYGCRDPENAALAQTLRDAVRVLPIEEWIAGK